MVRVGNAHHCFQQYTYRKNLSSTYKCNFLGADNKQ